MRVDKTFGASVVAMLFRIQKFASEAEAVAHVKGLKTQAKAQAARWSPSVTTTTRSRSWRR